MRDAWQNPHAILAALSVYEKPAAPAVTEDTAEAKAILTALEELKAEEQATAQAQVAGIRAGAAPEIYAALFADIAARRQALHARPAAAERTANPAPARKPTVKHPVSIKTPGMETALQAFEQAWRVLTSPAIEGHIKRDLLLTIIDRVICQKDGAEVVFLPGLFGEAGEKKDTAETTEPTLYTTCIVCQVRAEQCLLVIEQAGSC